MNQIAILLSTYNGEKFIKEQLTSLAEQSYREFDIYIRDDGSSDKTLEYIDKFIQDSDLSIKLLSGDENVGALLSFFTLLREVSAIDRYGYIMFCDQDDIWLSNKVEISIERMQELERSYPDLPLLIHSDLTVVDERLDTIDSSYWSYQQIDPTRTDLNHLLVENVITGCTTIINSNLAKLALPIPTDAIMHDWWLGLVATTLGKIDYIETSTILYRQHSQNEIGASKFGFDTVVQKISKLSTPIFDRYIKQSKVLLDRYRDRLKPKDLDTLEAIVSIEYIPWYRGKMLLVKYNLSKRNFIKNIGLLLCR
ncbi:Alpha-L-Rha alpha-1,3-L-rhamnosyltransferase [hydrothermal vent metagenome]|uniref:Alpha-L-Rha alpha-1,3-L-rhamnosyltransferase n=1 Tax=hydrothermal vent metagenome TaxID=652676 RepID=A0A1W1C8Y4_9ZZZZ